MAGLSQEDGWGALGCGTHLHQPSPPSRALEMVGWGVISHCQTHQPGLSVSRGGAILRSFLSLRTPGLEPVPKPGVCSPTTCSPLCKGFHCLLWRKSEPPPSTYPPHNGSVRGVVYWPHSDMGVGNGGGTKCSQWDWEHPQVVFLAPLGVSSWCGYRWAQATAAHIGG